MRGDALVKNQRMMAQAVFAIADVVENAIGVQLNPITFAELPANPKMGMLVCISDSNRGSWGQVITGGGGSNIVLAFFDGTDWLVK